MNKTKIEYVDYTWNPVTGCLHNCPYCYAKRIAKRFSRGTGDGVNPSAYCVPGVGYIIDTEHNSVTDNPNIHVVKWPMYDEWIIREGEYGYHYDLFPYGFEPTFHRYRLNEPQKVKKPSKIFVCSMADLFGYWVPDEWIEEVIQIAEKCSWHKFLFLTKNPRRYYAFEFPDNCWLGASAVNKPDEKVIEADGGFKVTTAHVVADTMRFFKHSFISFEPLLNDVMQDCDIDGIDWVIVGAQTGPGAKPPKPEWVQNIIDRCREAGVLIFLKNNLEPYWKGELIQEFPGDLK